jgi:4-aminobutyrate aminotransferase
LSYKIGGGCIITLCPPLNISEKELISALEIIKAGLQEISRKD